MPSARIDARVRVALPVSFSDGTVAGETVNLSVSGMNVQLREQAILPERTDFRLLLPDDTPISGECRIMRYGDGEYLGVFFVRMPSLDVAYLRLYLTDTLGDALYSRPLAS